MEEQEEEVRKKGNGEERERLSLSLPQERAPYVTEKPGPEFPAWGATLSDPDVRPRGSTSVTHVPPER